ncbi:MAG: F0F1 ATP synthase subunit A, partial [Chitinophagaceae bacterium]
MVVQRFKSFTVAAFSIFSMLFSVPGMAQHHEGDTAHQQTGQNAGDHDAKKGKLNVGEVIFEHVLDGHEFHFLGKSLPLPVILYSPQKGFTSFMSSDFHHGHAEKDGYMILTHENIAHLGLDPKTFKPETIIAVKDGKYDPSVKVYDFSLTRNVVQMILALTLFVIIMLRIAKRYKSGVGVTSAPKGSQSLLEPVITFVRDEVAKPNLGHKYEKYLPYLLTVFFFILINNIFGLIPGSANVTGNIAFTAVLGLISFVVIMFSTNKHY